MSETLWAIVPCLDLVEMSIQTCLDLLAQTIPVRILLLDQGSAEASNEAFRAFADAHHPRVLLASYNPALPSLSAAWNRGLAMIWGLGAEEAWVCNSDIRVRPDTGSMLRTVLDQTCALFVSAVGVGLAEYVVAERAEAIDLVGDLTSRGGPDFSCFLLTKAAHARYPFDEAFIPCYGEDCDVHRRYMLGGDGDKIFSINLPFHHIQGGSRTVNQSPEARERFEKLRGIGAAHYVTSWGGSPNYETYTRKGDPTSACEGVTNPDLQRRVQAGLPALDRELEGAEELAAVEAAFARKMEEIRGREA